MLKEIKKGLSLAILALLLLQFAACSSIKSTDDQFFSDLFKTWQAKQELLAKDPKNENYLKDSFNKEWEMMHKYQGKKFKDDAIGQNANTYLTELKGCVDTINQETSIENQKAFNEHYKKRIAALKNLKKDSRFVVQENRLEEFNVEKSEEIIQKQAKNTEALKQLEKDLNAVKLKVQAESTDSQAVYAGEIANHSSHEFKNLGIIYKFVNKDKEVLATDTWRIDSFKPGQKATIKIKNTAPKDTDHTQIELEKGLEIN